MNQPLWLADPVAEMFSALRYDPQKVDLRLTDMTQGVVWICLIEVLDPYKGTGEGRRTLAMLCELADTWGVDLMLKAVSMADMEQADLEAWYGRAGFITLRRDENGWPTMSRTH